MTDQDQELFDRSFITLRQTIKDELSDLLAEYE